MTASPSWTVNFFRVGIACVISVLSGSTRSRPDFIHHLLGIPNDSAKDRRNEEVALGLMRLGAAISALTTLLVPIAWGKESVPSDCQMHGSRPSWGPCVQRPREQR